MKKQDIAKDRLELKREIKNFLLDNQIMPSEIQMTAFAETSTEVLEIIVYIIRLEERA